MSSSRGRNVSAGFTLVETLIGVILVSLLLAIVFRIFTYINLQRARGTVDLQEIQGARYAVSYLRRDFRCAAPKIAKTATFAQKVKAVRVPAVIAQSYVPTADTVPIVISDSEIHFFRQMYDTPDQSPTATMEEVIYRIDASRNCLVRLSAGREQVFQDIKGARFELYGHPLQPEIPMLRVVMLVDAGAKDPGGGPSRFLELTTSISSSLANQNLNNLYWHRVYY